MKDYIRKLSLTFDTPDETEGYYEEMAKQGLIIKKKGIWFDQFEQSQPQNLKFRIESLEEFNAEDMDSENLKNVYKENGWLFAGSSGTKHIFYIEKDKEDTDVPDVLNKRSYEKRHKSIVKRAIRTCIGRLLLNLFWIFYIVHFSNGQFTKSLIEDTEEISLFIFFLVFSTSQLLKQMLHILKLRKLKDSTKRPVSWKKNKQAKFMNLIIYSIICFIFSVILITNWLKPGKVELPIDGTNQPYILLDELEDVRRMQAEEASDVLGYASELEAKQSILAPVQYHTYEKGISEADKEYTPYMYQDYYETLTASAAKKIAYILVDSSLLSKASDFQKMEEEDLDLVLMAEEEVIIADDKKVLHIFYTGDMSMERIVELIKEKW